MSPKFRGNSDDWLDNQKISQAKQKARPAKTIEARALGLPLAKSNGVVTEVFPKLCRVQLDDLAQNLLCTYRRASVVSKSKTDSRERTPVAVGDRVLARQTGALSSADGIIEGICIRKNELSRPAPGRDAEKFQHVIAANLDLLVIVASAKEPEFRPGLMDRILVSAEISQIPALLCITKLDLASGGSSTALEPYPWQIYEDLGYPVVTLDLKKKVEESPSFIWLKNHLSGRQVAFCGQSGVGKTTLMRTLLESPIGRIGEISVATGKGKHTTTGAVLYYQGNDSKWIDTPGIKEFGLKAYQAQQLSFGFKEFRNLECARANCLHYKEEHCQARHLARYPSYLKVLESLQAGEN